MTATDELRAMLDERGVEWKAKALYFMDICTVFSTSSDFEWIVIWDKNTNNLSITNYKNGLTPTQVIAATLGNGTCHDKGYIDDGEWYFVCSDCGCEFEYTDFACEFADGRRLGSPNFCPKCGRRIEVTA